MSAIFYQTYWHTVGGDLSDVVRSFFAGGHILSEINRTNICLIPKSSKASTVNQFRPISLCNVAYKIISKILAYRIRPLLDQIISPNQTAFIQGRGIAENTILAQEIVHQFKKKKGKGSLMMLKIDIAKAFDKVEWSFLLQVLKLLIFPDQFIKMIEQCISTASFSVLINGGPLGNFHAQRGLRQGDPLSPALFVICTEILSRLIHREALLGNLKGIKISRSCEPISLLMFADNLLIFARASKKDATAIKS